MQQNTDDQALPMSGESTAGMTQGAQGDASASDVTQGFTSINLNQSENDWEADEAETGMPDDDAKAGFAGRPEGWER